MGGASVAEGEFQVRNTGRGTLGYRVHTTNGNLWLSPESGSLGAGMSATIRLTYTCRNEGADVASVEVIGGQSSAMVTLRVECQSGPSPPAGFEYSDVPPLPDGASVATPWHMTNVRVDFDGVREDFDSFCVTLRIEGETSDDVNLYISPFNGTLNRLTYYGGIQTRIDGNTLGGSFVRRGRGAIFSRWRERDTGAISRAGGGLIQSAGNEGDFISVRNDFAWSEGRYRLCLRKGDEIAGDPLPVNYTAGDIAFAWEKYVHTWVRMEAIDLASAETTIVGALAVPGSTLELRHYNVLFAEMYGAPSPIAAERVPDITVFVEDFKLNGQVLPYRALSATSNPIPGRADTPKMTRVRYDAGEKEIRIEIGGFTGRFGVFRTSVHPSRAAVESASLASIDGQGYIVALRDGQTIGRNQLPRARLNFRADPVDAGQVASMRLELTGPVAMSGLTNDAPYVLSGGTAGLSLPLGEYRFTATPFTQADGQGEQGTAFDAKFRVAAGAQTALFQAPQLVAHVEAALGAGLSGPHLAREFRQLRHVAVAEGGVSDLNGIENAINLRILRLPGNEIRDVTALSGLHQLAELDLSGNQVRDIAPLRGLTGLRRLNLRDNAIADIGPLGVLTALEQINLSGNQIGSLEPLTGLATLRQLDLARNDIEDLASLAALPRLQVLDISGNRVRDLAPLAGLIALHELYANGNGIADLTPLTGLAGLRRLTVSRNRIIDLGPLGGLQNLTLLEAKDNRMPGLGVPDKHNGIRTAD